MKKILFVTMMVLFVFSVVGCQGSDAPSTWEDIEERGYLVVGLDDTFAPMGFRDEDSELVGFDVDLAKAVGEELDIEIRFQPIDWNSKVLELNSGAIDVIWNGLTITDSRLEEMTFSDPYLANRQVVIVRDSDSITSLSDLADLSVGVQIDSAAQEAVEASEFVSSFSELLTYDTYDQALLELSSESVDAVVIDEIMGRYMIAQSDEDMRVLDDDFGDEEYGIGFRLEATDLRDKIDATLDILVEEGVVTEISEKWFGEDIFLR